MSAYGEMPKDPPKQESHAETKIDWNSVIQALVAIALLGLIFRCCL